MIDIKNVILAWELHQRKVMINNIANHCDKHRSTISRWISGVNKIGLKEYLDLYRVAKENKRPGRQINSRTKDLIISIYNKNPISGYKLQKILKKKYNIKVSVSKIYLIMKVIANEKHIN